MQEMNTFMFYSKISNQRMHHSCNDTVLLLIAYLLPTTKRLCDALAQPFASLSGLYPYKVVSNTLKIIGLEGSAPSQVRYLTHGV